MILCSNELADGAAVSSDLDRATLARIVKSAIRSLLGESLSGMIEYYCFPARRASWGGPFNGQQRRCELFTILVEKVRPVAIVETGAYLGTTTEFMADSGVPIYSVESNRRFYGFARARLWRKRHVTIRLDDSREALRAFFAAPLTSPDGSILAYLDAHWNEDLPLADELEIIFSNCAAAVAMIDDFEVPADPGFAYDDYGSGKALNAAYIAPAVAAHDLAIFYPAASSQEETGLRRGCVVLCKADFASRLERIPALRRVSTPRRSIDFETAASEQVA